MKPGMRIVVFLLASTSIGSLLGEMYRVWPMRLFTLAVFLPCCGALAFIAWLDRRHGSGQLCRLILTGAIAGLAGAVSYDIFRLPFVFSVRWGLERVVPPLPLFKVFPQFGAMILRQTDAHSLAAQVTGWSYHFSNGITFGIMCAAMVNGRWRARWAVPIAFAVALELGMLLTPYPATFGIQLTATFIVVTLMAHTLFGITMALAGIGMEGNRARC